VPGAFAPLTKSRTTLIVPSAPDVKRPASKPTIPPTTIPDFYTLSGRFHALIPKVVIAICILITAPGTPSAIITFIPIVVVRVGMTEFLGWWFAWWIWVRLGRSDIAVI
jgi:hypothetical protein